MPQHHPLTQSLAVSNDPVINSEERLSKLQQYSAVVELPEVVFDDFTQLALSICEAPISTITMVDSDQQWFTSHRGLDLQVAPLEDGFCPRVVASQQRLIVMDALATPEKLSNAMVTEHGVRFYAGVPLATPDGHVLGAICVMDKRPRKLEQSQLKGLEALARQVMILLTQNLEKIELLKEVKMTRQQAELANQMKDDFLAVVSHELRSPLNPIVGWASLLRRGQLSAEKTEQAIETIERNALLQVTLIDNLLDVSQILRGKITLNKLPVDLGRVVTTVIGKLSAEADTKSIQIHTQGLETPVRVVGDRFRLRQIVTNLLSNAIRFTPKEGEITIALSTEPVAASDKSEKDTVARLEIKDTGTGISAEFLPHVFDQFRQEDYSTTRQVGGLGLGLKIVKQLVEMHGGTIEAQSAGKDQGATFMLRLPLVHLSSC